jgi:hypothetical protein
MINLIYINKTLVLLAFSSLLLFIQPVSAQSSEIVEPSMVWQYGGAPQALDYSIDHQVIAFVCTIGEDAPYSDKEIADALDQNIFAGKTEVPIAIFIYPEKVKNNQSAVCTAYIRGYSFRDDYTGEKNLSPQELVASAPQLVNKLTDMSRTIDTNPQYFLKPNKDN